jgi:acetylornithine deacetylase/succinyl-diaminopimelate desuccinylase-like protein
MKNMAAMCTAILRRLSAKNVRLERDVIFAAVADEEAGCDLGSRFLVEQHKHLVEAEYAIGEAAGSRCTSASRRSIRCRSPRRASAGSARA